MQRIKGAIFDLDGVLVDTAKYHYLAWKRLADKLGFVFTEKDNERLKGVSRVKSLEILLEIGNIKVTESEKNEMAELKNYWYVEYLYHLDSKALLPGAVSYLQTLHKNNIGIALGSASKNAPLILNQLKIKDYFDVIIDGNAVSKAKPDPEVFVKGALELGFKCSECVVFEDSLAGIKAAKSGGMYAVGIGKKENLPGATRWVNNLSEMPENLEDFVLGV